MIESGDKRSIFIVGFMASGKSTVGPVLAELLGVRFLDLDRRIEEESGMTIGSIIDRFGEDRFREIETAALEQAIGKRPIVVAPGGGAIRIERNRRLMAESGVTIWLDAPFELCWERIGRDEVVRPLARDEESARARYRERLPLYEMATLRIAVDGSMSPEEIAGLIIEALPEA